ncbi:response regulator transcription factor [Streptomyces sp. NPDC015684]|uniref:response regulator transcription factor n=1 Tax=Streptomyces sp. NPDC015684 TaxID=3364963 RepID=UPI0036FF6EFA
MSVDRLGPPALARIRASVERNPRHPAAQTIQMLLDEIDRLKTPAALTDWHPDAERPLTRRQMEVLVGTANGESCEQIGPRLGIDPKSVRKHRQAIMRRLGVSSMPTAVAVCLVNGWVPSGALRLPKHQRRMSTVVARNTYRERAAVLRRTPGEWGTVALYDSGATARQSAYRLRTGAFKAFRPVGLWDAEAFTHDGTHGVRARFKGVDETGRAAG